MVELARAMASRPSLLLLDEPASGLSEDPARAAAEVLPRSAKSRACCLSSTTSISSPRSAERILVLESGALVFTGTGEEFRSSELVNSLLIGAPPTTDRATPLGSVGRTQATAPRPHRIGGETAVRAAPAAACHAVEMAHQGVPLVAIQCQPGHANLGITSVYLHGIDSSEIRQHRPWTAIADDLRHRRPPDHPIDRNAIGSSGPAPADPTPYPRLAMSSVRQRVGRRAWCSNQRGRTRFPAPRLHGRPDAPCVHAWDG